MWRLACEFEEPKRWYAKVGPLREHEGKIRPWGASYQTSIIGWNCCAKAVDPWISACSEPRAAHELSHTCVFKSGVCSAPASHSASACIYPPSCGQTIDSQSSPAMEPPPTPTPPPLTSRRWVSRNRTSRKLPRDGTITGMCRHSNRYLAYMYHALGTNRHHSGPKQARKVVEISASWLTSLFVSRARF